MESSVKLSGIYIWRSPESDALYVGQSTHMQLRWKREKREALAGEMGQEDLLEWIRAFKESAVPEEIELDPTGLSPEQLHEWRNEAENFWYWSFKSFGFRLLNMIEPRGAPGPKVRAKISERLRGRSKSAETRANMSRAQRTLQNLPEVRARKSLEQKQVQNRPEVLAKRILRRGEKRSALTRQRISEACKGRIPWNKKVK